MAKAAKSGAGAKSKPKLTDAERHKRFVDMAKEIEASEKSEDFDKAFGRVISEPPKPKASQHRP